MPTDVVIPVLTFLLGFSLAARIASNVYEPKVARYRDAYHQAVGYDPARFSHSETSDPPPPPPGFKRRQEDPPPPRFG